MSFETQGNQTFGQDIPEFCRDSSIFGPYLRQNLARADRNASDSGGRKSGKGDWPDWVSQEREGQVVDGCSSFSLISKMGDGKHVRKSGAASPAEENPSEEICQ